jgi:2-methylisocitrate lyase-like PEP mutase family enzyme
MVSPTMKTAEERRADLKALLGQGGTLILPGAYDPLSARLIEQAGFPAVYVGSYATSAARLGLPDVGAVTMDEMVAHARAIAEAVDLPVIADAENGWFNAANIWKTVHSFEHAGICGIHIEDHEFGKHAPVTPRLTSGAEAAARIRAAVDARKDPNFLIIARSDALWITGDMEEVVRRLTAYTEAGADMVMPTRVSPEQLGAIRARVAAPVVITDRPGVSVRDEERTGVSMVLYYGLSLYAAYHGVKQALSAFAACRDADAVPHVRDQIAEFEAFIDYGPFATRAQRYGLG